MTPSFTETVIRGVSFSPALFCAPMAGITHSAFRRLVAEFGGCGGFWSEMLSARMVLHEDSAKSPYLRRDAREHRLIYQLMVDGDEPLDRVVGYMAGLGADGLDINLACHAPKVRKQKAGSSLFEDSAMLRKVLTTVRANWPGLLTVKIRFGTVAPGWEDRFIARMRLFEETGMDAVVLHPRFFEDKFKRRARLELLPWVRTLTRLPLIANGDIMGRADAEKNADVLQHACGLMIGRKAAVQPWVFAGWDRPVAVDMAEVWFRFLSYVCADFPAEKALPRMKVFTGYYARNFKFGHTLHMAIQNALTEHDMRLRAKEFFDSTPEILPEPSVMGL